MSLGFKDQTISTLKNTHDSIECDNRMLDGNNWYHAKDMF